MSPLYPLFAVVAPTRQDWLLARHTRVTASDAACLLGLNPHKSRKALLREKRLPQPKDVRGSSAMRAGQFLEEGVFNWWLDDLRQHQARHGNPEPTGELLRTSEGTSILVVHQDVPDLLAGSPDGLVKVADTVRVVEIKTHGPQRWPEEEAGTYDNLAYQLDMRLLPEPKVENAARCWATPTQYIQVQVQLACTGLQAGYLARAWGNVRRDTVIYACPEIQALLIEETKKFWEEVRNGNND